MSSAAETVDPAPALAEDNTRQEQQSDKAPQETQRDPDVLDEIWAQLQADMRANELAEKQSQNAIADLQQEVDSAVTNEGVSSQGLAALKEAARASPSAGDDDDDEMNKPKHRHEEARLRGLMASRAKKEAEEKLRRAREDVENRSKEEAKVQKKLRDMGIYPVGFRWIKQGIGYMCAGGSHFVSNAQLGV
jgi:hypothetical protein